MTLVLKLLRSLHFLSARSLFCFNEMTLGGLLDNVSVGLRHDKGEPVSIVLDFPGGEMTKVELTPSRQ